MSIYIHIYRYMSRTWGGTQWLVCVGIYEYLHMCPLYSGDILKAFLGAAVPEWRPTSLFHCSLSGPGLRKTQVYAYTYIIYIHTSATCEASCVREGHGVVGTICCSPIVSQDLGVFTSHLAAPARTSVAKRVHFGSSG